MNITTERLNIRNIRAIDFDDMYEYMSDEDVMKYESNRFNKQSLETFLYDVIPSKRFFAVILKKTHKMIGHIYVGKTQPEKFNEYNVGYILNPEYHNQGYCTEAVKELCRYAFEVLNAHRLTAKCNPENVASWRVMEKSGFIKEGLLRSRVALRNDSFGNPIHTDELIYGMLREDIK
jgi:RimJ/RimL family protein N-acetyltransferase